MKEGCTIRKDIDLTSDPLFFTISLSLVFIILMLIINFNSLFFVYSCIFFGSISFGNRVTKLKNRWREIEDEKGKQNRI